ncbi:MAG TPA: hypothetical protein VG225_00205 [Terracidiphilus sp.]|nr:hypothetical protein [Terracidiphilus sp.]
MIRNLLAKIGRRWLCFGLLAASLAAVVGGGFPVHLAAQEKPYFVTYSHDLEEPGNVEIETKTALARPDGGTHYGATASELEYGVRAWWTSELYLDGQTTPADSTLLTGFRLENRFRPLMREHWINPVLYVEYENISGADKTVLEVVGHDGQSDLAARNGDARREHQHEGELKLILSSNVRDWNISENFIAEKDLSHSPWEFGYAVGAARPLRTSLNARECTFCAEKLMVGAEAYGGLGNTWALTTRDTSHYVALLVGWELPGRMRISFSPGFGLTGSSLDRVYRVGVAYEMPQVGSWFRGAKGGAR